MGMACNSTGGMWVPSPGFVQPPVRLLSSGYSPALQGVAVPPGDSGPVDVDVDMHSLLCQSLHLSLLSPQNSAGVSLVSWHAWSLYRCLPHPASPADFSLSRSLPAVSSRPDPNASCPIGVLATSSQCAGGGFPHMATHQLGAPSFLSTLAPSTRRERQV